MIEYNKLDNWVAGYFIRNNQNIGTVVPIEETANSDWKYQMFQVSKGDKIYCKFTGGNSARAIAILDDEYKLVYNSGVNLAIDETYEIEQDGFVILNTWTVEPLAYHYPFSQDNTDLGRVYTTHNHGEDTTEEYQVTIGENVYPAVKIGNQIWTAKNLDENLGTLGSDEWYYNGRSIATKVVEYNSGNMTIRADSIYDNLAYFWDWETGVRATASTKVKSKLTNGLSLNCTLTFSEALKSDQTVYYHVARIIDDGVSYISNARTIPAGTTTYNYNYKFSPSNKDYDVRHIIFRLGANSTNAGITCAWSNINISYNYVDNVVTNTTLPQALANEEIAKANNYGRLYTWTNVNDNLSKLNLNGWRWSTKSDFDGLVALDPTGATFRDKSYNGNNSTGLSIVHSGYRSLAGQNFSGGSATGTGYLFTSTPYVQGSTAEGLRVNPTSISTGHYANGEGFAIRLVLDIPEDGSLPDGTVRLEKTNQARNIGKGYIQDNNYQPGDFNVNEQMTLMGKYGVTKIGNQLWITENLDEELGTLGVDEWYYNGRSKIGAQINYNTTVTTSSWSSLSTDSITFYNWEDGKISGTTATGFAIPCVDRKVTISFDYEYASDVSETKSFAVYVNGFRKDGTYSQGSWCGTSPSYSSKSGSMKFTTTLSNEIELLQTMRFTSLISGNKITIRNLRIVWGNTMSTTLVTLPQALANEEIAKANNYGKLYDWNNINDNLSKLNLNGWRVPTTDDSDKFFEIDNTLMKFFKKSLGGSDIYGFGLFGAGVWSGTSFSVSNVGRYWSSNKSNDVAYRFLAFDGPLSIYRSSYGALYQGASIRLVLDLNPDGSYPEDATPLKPRETYKPYNRNIGTGAKPYIPNDDGKVYVDDVRCDIVCPHDKPETSETNSISLASEPIIEE